MESANGPLTHPTSDAPDARAPGRFDWLPPYPWREECHRPTHWVRLWGRAVRLVAGTALRRPLRFGGAFRRALQLLGREQFTPQEIRRLGLLRMDGRSQVLPAVSRRAMERIAGALNPSAARLLVGDKSAFHFVCERRGLPTPRLLAVFRPDCPGWTFTGGAPVDVSNWEQFFERAGSDEFVVKPVTDGWGRGVRLFARGGSGGWRDPAGVSLDAAGLVAWMMSAGRSRGCVIQERVRGHAELDRLSGSPYLQTIRCITLLDRSGVPRLLHAHCKIITGTNCVDNFMYGNSGNLIAPVRIEDGSLERSLAADPHGGFVEVPRHPDTGHVLAGFQLPDWTSSCELALRAAREFAPLRFVGWDIAPTPDGPVLIEGNWNTDPPNHSGHMDRVIEEIRRLA